MTTKAFRLDGLRFYGFNPMTGLPLAFGKVYLYEPGTTTPKASYVDEDGAVTNTHPVTLNASGYANINMKGAYRVVLTDANDVTIWTQDRVSMPIALGDVDLETLTTNMMLAFVAGEWVARTPEQVRTIIGSDQPALVSLGNLTTAPNQLPYLAAANTYQVLPFAPWAQGFISMEDAPSLPSESPIGTIIMFGGNTPPARHLKCNGAAVSRTTYAELFAAIGTAWGAGNGSTTFNLPDFRGEFVRGWDDGRGVDSGRSLGSYQAQSVADHRHLIAGTGGTQAGPGTLVDSANLWDNNAALGQRTGTAVSSVSGDNRPRNAAPLFCIKHTHGPNPFLP